MVKPGGYLYIIAPHKRTLTRNSRSTLAGDQSHATGKVPETLNDLFGFGSEISSSCPGWLGWSILHVQDTDDKVGNGFDCGS